MKYKFGERLKALRKESGETQVQLAQKIGLTQAALSLLEKGKFNASKHTAQIADHYKVNALWLATGVGHKEVALADSDQEEMTRIYLSLDEGKRKILLALVKSMAPQ
jgi:transcriptional regulator with XRE-family HTH domain